MIRILLADDHPFYREGIRALLDGHPVIELAAVAASGEEAVEAVAVHRPDVVVMDLAMPGMGGLAAIRALTAADPALPVLVLTMHDDDSVFAALRAGARGYLLKDAGVDELARAVVSVQRGEAIFSPSTARRLRAHFAQDSRRPSIDAFPALTDREHDVLALLAEDLGTAAIARRLGLSEKTVYNYVAVVLTKLRARDRAEAGRRAREAGLGARAGSSDADHDAPAASGPT